MNWENDTFVLVQRMRAMVYSSKDFESLWFLYQAEGLPKNISIEEFCTKHGVLAPEWRKNSLAERSLRTLTVECKRSLTFGSHAGVEISVIYHTFIQTCKMCGVSTLEYFKQFFKAIMQGRTDYERSALPLLLPSGRKNMLPMTIGIKK